MCSNRLVPETERPSSPTTQTEKTSPITTGVSEAQTSSYTGWNSILSTTSLRLSSLTTESDKLPTVIPTDEAEFSEAFSASAQTDIVHGTEKTIADDSQQKGTASNLGNALHNVMLIVHVNANGSFTNFTCLTCILFYLYRITNWNCCRNIYTHDNCCSADCGFCETQTKVV